MVLVGPATGLMVDLLGLGAAAGAGAAALENTRWDIPTAGVSTVLRKVGMVMVVVTKNDESQEADWSREKLDGRRKNDTVFVGKTVLQKSLTEIRIFPYSHVTLPLSFTHECWVVTIK